jgi:hypothetical protein
MLGEEQVAEYCNADAKLFTWTATAGEILVTVAWVQTRVRQHVDNNAR